MPRRAAGVIGLLPIHIDDTISPEGSLFAIARQYELSAYDATYIDLALRNGAALVTFDQRLAQARDSIGLSAL